MLGETDQAMKTIHNFHQVWKQYGFTPEYYNIPKNEAHKGREGYPLRPGMELFKECLKFLNRLYDITWIGEAVYEKSKLFQTRL